MGNKRHYAVVLGARPNFVKAAPFFNEAKNHPDYQFTIIHTGQHFDDSMSKVFFDQMKIPCPNIHLDIQGEFHTEKLGKMFSALKDIFTKQKFDGVIVFGDINSTLAGAIAAAKNTKLIHIESGLRSHDRRMPEEINRAIVDHLSDLLFTTEPIAELNLLKEGIDKNKIKYVGNIMIESLETYLHLINESNILDLLGLKKKEYIVVTLHRVENTDNPIILGKLLRLIKDISEKIKVILPLHPGTRQKIALYKFEEIIHDLNIIEPLGYFEFMKLVLESKGVVTDSGGIQEETSHLGIPCATLRDNTERPITLDMGSNKLFPIDEINSNTVVHILEHLNKSTYKDHAIPLWDGLVSKRIFNHLDQL